MFVQGRGAGAKPHTVRVGALPWSEPILQLYPIVVVTDRGWNARAACAIRKPADHKVYPTQGAAQVTGAAACCPATAYLGTTCPKAVLLGSPT